MGKQSDRNIDYMKNEWGTEELITDYNNSLDKKFLSEVNFDEDNLNKNLCTNNCQCKKNMTLLSE